MSDKLQVFISYARADGEPFALSLVAALEAAGFDPFLDQHDIIGGEDWKRRLTDLLSKADTIVYVITPGAIGSAHCAWEVNEAQRLSKRLIPVVAIEAPVESMPPALQRLNHIHFSRQLSFGEALRQLAGALRTDLDWVREHTRINGLAADWRARESREEWLVRGEQLAAAKAWLAAWKPGSPEPTDAQRAFIKASEEAEGRRDSAERQQLADIAAAQAEREKALKRAATANRWVTGLAGVLLVGVVTGASGAYWLWDRGNRALAEKEEELASDQLTVQDRAEQLGIDRAAFEPEAPIVLDKDTAGASPDDTRSETSPAPEAPSEPPILSPAPARVADRWNFDIFWCEGQPASEARAAAVREHLELERSAGEAIGAQPGVIQIGRVRARMLDSATNARPGYRVRTDEIRAEDSESKAAAQLRSWIEPAAGVTLANRRATTRTSNYLSVFLCSDAP